MGGLVPLLKLLDSKNGSLQHNAAFALYGLADNEDNVSDFIRVGGVQRLQDGEFIVQATKDCVAKTLKRLEEKIHGRVLNHLLYLMRVAEKPVQRRVAFALAHLCSPDDQRTIFIDNNGHILLPFFRLELLLGLLGSTNPKQQLDGAVALYKLANKAMTLSPMDAAPPSPTPQASLKKLVNIVPCISKCTQEPNEKPIIVIIRVYLGEQYVNNATLSDVTFLVEGRRFYAHRICLLASSDAFRAMFDGGYRVSSLLWCFNVPVGCPSSSRSVPRVSFPLGVREKDARDIEIPNIRWEVFELMMRFIYTGSVDVSLDIAQDLLGAADQYLLEGLKRLCEYTIAQDVTLDNVSSMYELSEAFHAISLRHTCILFILEHFSQLSDRPGRFDRHVGIDFVFLHIKIYDRRLKVFTHVKYYRRHSHLIQRIIPEIRNYFAKALTNPNPHNQRLNVVDVVDVEPIEGSLIRFFVARFVIVSDARVGRFLIGPPTTEGIVFRELSSYNVESWCAVNDCPEGLVHRVGSALTVHGCTVTHQGEVVPPSPKGDQYDIGYGFKPYQG
ncbi:hypothetical protein Gotur_007712 [Gossypium turneri]